MDWYELLREGDRMESLINGHWQIMEEFDPQHRIKLVVDEWGPWYKPGTEVSPTDILGQMITLARCGDERRDSGHLQSPSGEGHDGRLRAADQLPELFVSRARRSFRCNAGVSRFSDVLGTSRSASVRAVFSSPSVNYTRDDKPASFWGLQGSVSVKDKDLTITVVNPDVHQPRETEIVLRASEIKSGTVTVLTDNDIHAHNTFENPDAVRPRSEALAVTGSNLRHTFPPASVTLIQAKIA